MFGLMTLPAMAGELEQPMKKIGFNYKQAVKADDAATMEKYINEMKAQFDIAKQKNMPTAKKEKFLEGMNEVQTELDASLAALKAGDEAKAREHLAKVNDLKKEYHKYAKQKADPFHWDSLVRLTHWGVAAICIGNLWLNEAGEEWHERLGYLAIALISLRLAWGSRLPRAMPGCEPSSQAGQIFASKRWSCASARHRPPVTTAAASWRSGRSGC